MYSMKALLLSFVLSSTASISAQAITTDECPRQQGNPFNLSQANANALVAVACTALSHIGNERKNFVYEDSATMFHLWKTTGNYNLITVEGYCAVPLKDLRAGKLSSHRINLTLKQDPEKPVNSHILVEGVIGGKSLSLEMDNNQFLDQRCTGGEASYTKIRGIGLGISLNHLGQNIVDMLRSGTTFAPLTALETMSWVSGRHSDGASFPEFGVQFDMGQMNGRHLGIVASQGGLGNIIDVRSAVLLNYHDGSDYFALRKDAQGLVSGFAHEESSTTGDNAIFTNNKYQASNVRGGSQVLGCSSLIFESELALPKSTADLNICRRNMEPTSLGIGLEKEVQMTNELTPAQSKAKFERLMVLQKAVDYVNSTQGLAKAYASKPKVYEQGRIPWQASDIDRGFVITQRNITLDETRKLVMVTESRTNVDGHDITIKYQLKFSQIK